MQGTEIDGVDIHFLHLRSPHQGALPLIMTHGWPGSIVELLETVEPLTNPTTHGGRATDAFELVLPSMPGDGFSDQPTELGWDSGRVARAWAELMGRLGDGRYVAQGGDVGAVVTDNLGRQAPAGLLGIHLNLLVTALGGAPCRPTPTRSAPRPPRWPRSPRPAAARWSSRPGGRRGSARRCWTPPSPWRAGCWITTPTATPSSPAPSSADPRRQPHPRPVHRGAAGGVPVTPLARAVLTRERHA